MKRLWVAGFGVALGLGALGAMQPGILNVSRLNVLHTGGTNCTIVSGTVDPEAAVVGKPCDVYLNDNGTIWTKGDATGTDNSGWTQVGAAADIQTLLDGISTTQGVILYYNGTNWVALGTGTSGQYLQTNGAAANPAWADVTASGTDLTGTAPPQGSVSADVGDMYRDTTTGLRYYKAAGTATTTGWYLYAPESAMWTGAYLPELRFARAVEAASGSQWIGNQTVTMQGAPTYTSVVLDNSQWLQSDNVSLGANTGSYVAPGSISVDWSESFDFDLTVVLRTGSDLSSTQYWIGLSPTDPGYGTVPNHAVAMRYLQGTDGGWVGILRDGTTTNTSGTVASIAVSTAYRLRIRKVGSTAYFSVNDGTETTLTTNMPTSGVPYLELYFGGNAVTRTVYWKSFVFVIGEL